MILFLKGNCLILSKCGIKFCSSLGLDLNHLKRTFVLAFNSGKRILDSASQFYFAMFVFYDC